MKHIITFIAALLLWSHTAFSQDYNLTLVGQLDYELEVSDIWGYVSSSGTEYAIMGVENGTAIISLANPANPTEVAFVPGGSSIWRDMKTYGDYAYITTEATDGILVINLSDIDNGNISHNFYTPTYNDPPLTGQLLTIHNLYIDENGYCYIAGANLNNGGILIYDLNENPTEPPLVGVCENVYSHDVYVRNDTLYSSNINNGHFSVIDVSDKANPVTLAYQQTSFDFAHNAWLSDNGAYLFTTDELPNANIDAYDVSDVDNIQRLDTWVPPSTAGLGVIPHNVHVFNDYLVISYYTDGVKVVDAQRPHNLIEVGSYDTHTENINNFHGCWGAYPFLPSGLLLASDIEKGLFVFEPNYQRACYLEGTVTDANTNIPINNVSITLDSGTSTTTPANGEYATGQVQAGTFQATYAKIGYISQTIPVTLNNGELTLQDVALVPDTPISVSGQILDEETGDPIPNAIVALEGEQQNYNTTTNQQGEYQFDNIFQGNYQLYAGLWGYETITMETVLDAEDTNIPTQTLRSGYQDPFALDLGWTSESTASSGQWERGVPVGTYLEGNTINPDTDIEEDVGNRCYMTGNGGGNAGNDDVDGGTVRLISPIFDISNYENPYLYFRRWFMNAGGNGNPDDEFIVRLSNGTDEVILLQDPNNTNGWAIPEEYRIADYITPTANMQLIVETADFAGSGHLVEAALDDFRVSDGPIFATLTGQISLEEDGSPIANAPVRINGEYRNYHSTTDANGNYTITDVIPGDYGHYAGKWGYSTSYTITTLEARTTHTQDAVLSTGYRDPFALDLGWQVTGDATAGIWELDKPAGTELDGITYNVPYDVYNDYGIECYVTGNDNSSVDADDVDDGTTTLISPVFDLSTYNQAIIKYKFWFMNGGGNGVPLDDAMTISLSNGIEEVVIQTIDSLTLGWTDFIEIEVADFITPTANMRILVSVSDQVDTPHIVEAGFDQFVVEEGQPLSNGNLVPEQGITAYPNPVQQMLTLEIPDNQLGGNIQVIDTGGKRIYTASHIRINQLQWDTQHWPTGVYYLIYTQNGKSQQLQLIKQ